MVRLRSRSWGGGPRDSSGGEGEPLPERLSTLLGHGVAVAELDQVLVSLYSLLEAPRSGGSGGDCGRPFLAGP